jgi:uncharacterized protein (DUF2236 family)
MRLSKLPQSGLLRARARAEEARQRVQEMLLGLVRGPDAPAIDFTKGDAGLFGPESVTWRVHSDFASMLAGGISALFLQALHPLAMAGVYDHSNFREDPFGRLRRTATFLSGTTYGDRQSAEALLARVRRIHARVVGVAPDGRRYAAGDPALLTWIHTAEVSSFLAAYLRYVGPLSPGEQDRYYEEIALIAERLGAERVPKSAREVSAYFERLRPELAYGAQAREALELLQAVAPPHPVMGLGGRVFFEAAFDLLPPWARELLGIKRPPLVDAALVRPALRGIAALMRWAVPEGAADIARRRLAPDAPGGRR